MPQSKSSILVMYATDGVVVTCMMYASAPLAIRPVQSAYSNIYEERRVSLPMTTFAFLP